MCGNAKHCCSSVSAEHSIATCLRRQKMKRIIGRTLLAGIAAGFFGAALTQGANADTIIYRSWVSTPDTFIEAPTFERVVTRPVVIERPMVIERPATVETR